MYCLQAMGRILVGRCQVGAQGCFDEFNRLEERMLLAVSQQIQTIQISFSLAILTIMQVAIRGGGDMTVDLVGTMMKPRIFWTL